MASTTTNRDNGGDGTLTLDGVDRVDRVDGALTLDRYCKTIMTVKTLGPL